MICKHIIVLQVHDYIIIKYLKIRLTICQPYFSKGLFNMIKYSIAGLNILFDGYTNEYFRNRLSEYLSTDQEAEVDIIIKCEISDNIVPPKGKAVANINQRNWLITDDGGYASYDYNPDLEFTLGKDSCGQAVEEYTCTTV